MALSMDEQRMLAEIERRLAAEDPRLAARLSAFRTPSRVSLFRSARARLVGSLLTVAVVAMVSLMVYAILPFRAGSRTTGHPVTATVSSTGTSQPKIGAGPGTSRTKSSTAASAPASAKSQAKAASASGSTAPRSSASRPAAVHQADGAPPAAGHPAANAGQGP